MLLMFTRKPSKRYKGADGTRVSDIKTKNWAKSLRNRRVGTRKRQEPFSHTTSIWVETAEKNEQALQRACGYLQLGCFRGSRLCDHVTPDAEVS